MLPTSIPNSLLTFILRTKDPLRSLIFSSPYPIRKESSVHPSHQCQHVFMDGSSLRCEGIPTVLCHTGFPIDIQRKEFTKIGVLTKGGTSFLTYGTEEPSGRLSD